MARQEPPWLTALFTVVGFLIIGIGGAAAFIVVAYWPLFLGLGCAFAFYYWWSKSAWGLERDAKDRTAALLRSLHELSLKEFPTTEDFSLGLLNIVLSERDTVPVPELFARMKTVVEKLYEAEQFNTYGLGEPPLTFSSVEGARYRELVERRYQKLADVTALDAFCEALVGALIAYMDALPANAMQSREDTIQGSVSSQHAFTPAIELSDILPNLAAHVENVILPFYEKNARLRDVCVDLRNQLDRNLHDVSGVPFTREHRDSPKLILPSNYKGEDVLSKYLRYTTLESLFRATVPFVIPERVRFEHTHILAGSGHGKTQTLQHIILSDLLSESAPSLVIIDSQGDMIKKIARLALFDGELASKLIIIDPRDVPALNLFDVNFDRLGAYDETSREQILNGVIELYDYIFGSLLGAELTQKQSVIFRYLARLMLTIPGATLHDLIKLLSDHTPYLKYIEALPAGARMFFETEFPHKSFADTKRQIQLRLWGILENPTFERMLTAPTNRIDMFDALNSGKIVLVNTAKDFLKAERSSFLGRFFIALTLQAGLERAALPENKRHPSFLYIDEAADYFDNNVDDLLTQARKYKLGVVFSHQYLDQLSAGLRSSIASNTSIKLVGGLSDRDARSIAPDMRCTPSLLAQQRREKNATHFACYVRNITPQAVSLTIPLGTLERQPKMSEAAQIRQIQQNRARVGRSDAVGPIHSQSPMSPSPHNAFVENRNVPTNTQSRADETDWSG